MKTLLEIKNHYAQEQGYEDWAELWYAHIHKLLDFEIVMNDICLLAQKAALGNAAENVKMTALDFMCDCGQSHSDWNIDRKSITNPENLIQ